MRRDTGLGATSWVYIMASRRNGTIYVGVTSDLQGRVWDHRNATHPGSFTARYGCTRLVWYQPLDNIVAAIAREKAVEKYGRRRKLALIEADNPEWNDLFDDVYQ